MRNFQKIILFSALLGSIPLSAQNILDNSIEQNCEYGTCRAIISSTLSRCENCVSYSTAINCDAHHGKGVGLVEANSSSSGIESNSSSSGIESNSSSYGIESNSYSYGIESNSSSYGIESNSSSLVTIGTIGSTKERCSGLTKSGRGCSRNAKEGTYYCSQHTPSNSEQGLSPEAGDCMGTTASGRACRSKAKKFSFYCGVHDGQLDNSR
jgi:hypothetical protein